MRERSWWRHDARARAVAHDRSMPATEVRIVIELVQGGPQPKGELSVVGQPERSFAGWIGLIAALESAVNSQPARNSGTGFGGRLLSGEGTADGR